MWRKCITLLLIVAIANLPLSTLSAQNQKELIRRTPETAEQTKRAERQVTLDVQVADSSGKPIPNLKQQDLTLLDNGQPQQITSFREIEGASGQSPAEAILLIDTINATFQDVVLERQGAEAFLRQNGGRLPLPVSIVFLADTGVKLNKPSQDGNALAEDLSKLKTPIRVIGSAQGADEAQDREQRSLRALQLLSNYEAQRPGRKLLIWISPGWSLLSASKSEVSARDHKQYFTSIVDTTTALRRAHITLYSVAPLNLVQVSRANDFLYQSYLQGVTTPSQADSPNLALQVLALHSGGLALSKSGDLANQINRCVADGSSYYEITFDAADEVLRTGSTMHWK